jgi:hypothetical protein
MSAVTQRISEGLIQMRLRSTSWLRPVLVLVCLFALAAPLSAASRQRGRDDDRRGNRPRAKSWTTS